MVVPVCTLESAPVAVIALTAGGTDEVTVVTAEEATEVASCGVAVKGGRVSTVSWPFRVTVMIETDCAMEREGRRIDASRAVEETMATVGLTWCAKRYSS